MKASGPPPEWRHRYSKRAVIDGLPPDLGERMWQELVKDHAHWGFKLNEDGSLSPLEGNR